jgi:hypothetical protein
MHCRRQGTFGEVPAANHSAVINAAPQDAKALNRLGFTSAICDLTSAIAFCTLANCSYPVRPLCKFRLSSLAENPYPTPHSSEHPIRSVSCRTNSTFA